ncbi:hypothetical protein [Hydrogenophaga sp.]|jgi:hypothetical protein|uniref:hypothetical protein n=1 Tax=Hydrogenophaga sp. TaxID=1904254 RepID=UPI003F714991
MTEDISALARDEVRIRQIDSLRRMGRLDPRSADAQALLFTSVRDGFSRSASALLAMGVPPKYVGWTQQQADRYLAGDAQVASEMAVPNQVASTRRSVHAGLSRHPGRTAHCA